MISRLKNNVTVRDLTNDAQHEYDVSCLKPFLVAPGVDMSQGKPEEEKGNGVFGQMVR